MALLQMRFLGTAALSCGGVQVELPTRRALALLAWLAVECDRPHQRAHLAAMLWPDAESDAARTYLRQHVAQIQRTLRPLQADSPPLILSSSQTLAWNGAADALCDVQRLVDAALVARAGGALGEALPLLGRAAALYAGPFLEGFSLWECPEFDLWQEATAERLRQDALCLCCTLAREHEVAGSPAAALRWAQAALRVEPLSCKCEARLLHLLAQAGEPALALRHFERFRRQLAADLNVSPPPRLEQMVRAIRRGHRCARLDGLRGKA